MTERRIVLKECSVAQAQAAMADGKHYFIILGKDRDLDVVSMAYQDPNHFTHDWLAVCEQTMPSAGLMTSVDNDELGLMLLLAFHCALDSPTFVVGKAVEWLTRYWHLLAPVHEQIHKDIKNHIKMQTAGWAADQEDWRKILALPDALKEKEACLPITQTVA